MKEKITEKIKKGRLYFDGATGSALMEKGLAAGVAPEEWNITHPGEIVALHREYLSAGADIIKTNTFGINPFKYKDFEKRIIDALELARDAASQFRDKYIALDIGPLGKLLSPLGTLDFEDAVAAFSEIARAGCKGADVVLLETFTDLYELKAAMVGVKEACDLPIFATAAFDGRGKLMTGADVSAFVATLEGLGASAIGVNCSFGPDKAAKIIREMSSRASVPLIANPNAGLPTVSDGKVSYNVTPCDFSEVMADIAKCAMILGGCCGTTPEYIRKLREKTENIGFSYPNPKSTTTVASFTHAHDIGETLTVIGERINPTGKPKLKEALREQNFSYVMSEALSEEAGSALLDVNVGLPDIDEVSMLAECVKKIQSVSSLPLCIDTSNASALERAVRVYNGKPLINSVNGTAESISTVLPIAKKYGATVVALTLDESGIPDTAEGRVEIAKRIIREAKRLHIDKRDIIVDPLTLPISASPTAARVTLRAVELLAEAGIKTVLGVSNSSFGLPRREKINTLFLAEAMSRGLSAAILNPNSEAMLDVIATQNALLGKDESCADYIKINSSSDAPRVTKNDDITLSFAIKRGMRDAARDKAISALSEKEPLDIINSDVIPALDGIGRLFETGEAYLPELLSAAEAAVAAIEVVKEKIPKTESGGETVVLATVKGDIHDIGKNILKVMLESYGFKCVDLGRDVAPDAVLDAVKRTGAKLVGLSALMTTTVGAMAETVSLVRANCPDTCVMVGGAVLNPEYAAEIGAHFWGKDAMAGVRIAEELFGKRK